MLSSMRAIGYARVSTDKQADKGISPEVQQEKIRAMVVVQGAELIDIIVDGGRVREKSEPTGHDTAPRNGRCPRDRRSDHCEARPANEKESIISSRPMPKRRQSRT